MRDERAILDALYEYCEVADSDAPNAERHRIGDMPRWPRSTPVVNR